MLRIDAALVESASQASSPADIIPLVEAAILLEHTTIPPYLTAWLTLGNGDANAAVADVIRSIFIDEMLHMGLMANLLIALGGEPRFASAAFVPGYPHELPFGIGDGLEVSLRKCDFAQIDVFIAIEEPEDPIPVPEVSAIEIAADESYATIGEFYAALRASILALEPDAFAAPRLDRQVSYQFDRGDLAPIADAAAAAAAIDLIRLQGEGASTPFAQGDDAAHYYAFEQIAKQKLLHRTPNGPVFGPDTLPFDPTAVIDMEEGVRPDSYAAGTPQRAAVDTFVAKYSDMLRKLEQTFNGDPDGFGAALAGMRRVTSAGRDVLKLDSPTAPGKKAGLVFAYVL